MAPTGRWGGPGHETAVETRKGLYLDGHHPGHAHACSWFVPHRGRGPRWTLPGHGDTLISYGHGQQDVARPSRLLSGEQ